MKSLKELILTSITNGSVTPGETHTIKAQKSGDTFETITDNGAGNPPFCTPDTDNAISPDAPGKYTGAIKEIRPITVTT